MVLELRLQSGGPVGVGAQVDGIVPHAERTLVQEDGAVEMGSQCVRRRRVLPAGSQNRLRTNLRSGQIETEVPSQREAVIVDSQQNRWVFASHARRREPDRLGHCVKFLSWLL